MIKGAKTGVNTSLCRDMVNADVTLVEMFNCIVDECIVNTIGR